MTRLTGVTTQELAGDGPRTVTSETLVTCGEHVDIRRTSQETSGGSRPDGKTQVINKADIEQDEARGGGQHFGLERFPGLTISD